MGIILFTMRNNVLEFSVIVFLYTENDVTSYYQLKIYCL